MVEEGGLGFVKDLIDLLLIIAEKVYFREVWLRIVDFLAWIIVQLNYL